MFTFFVAVLTTFLTASSDALSCPPAYSLNPNLDFTCPGGCNCVVNVTNTLLPALTLKAEVKSTMSVNFNIVGTGARWTVQSAGEVTVNCIAKGSCTNLRLLGDGIKAHCIGTGGCGGVDCEGAGAKIVECYGYFTCEDCSAACDAP